MTGSNRRVDSSTFASATRSSRLSLRDGLFPALLGLAAASLFLAAPSRADVFTVGPVSVPKQYTEFHPTAVPLPTQRLDNAARQGLYRVLDAEQGFSIRPLVRGHKGIILHANGPVSPSGADYGRAIQENGASVDAGQRVVITNMLVDKDRIVFELNGGPDRKHRFLRHIEVGANGGTAPLAQDNGQEPAGTRITLIFDKYVPAVTGEQVEQLLAPLIDFKVKSPTEAYVDTLPPKLKETILAHQVLVGMNKEMVLAALGPPLRKSRERDGDMPFEEWIYGEPPKDVEFVRVNGNRVIRVEIAKVGQAPVIHAENEMGDYWSTVRDSNVHQVKLGDAPQPARDQEKATDKAATAPPSLRLPGDTLPGDKPADNTKTGIGDNDDDLTMKPVHFPKPDPSVAVPPPGSSPAPPASSPAASQPSSSGDSTPSSPPATPPSQP